MCEKQGVDGNEGVGDQEAVNEVDEDEEDELFGDD